MSRSLEYLVTDLLGYLDKYWSYTNPSSPIAQRMSEIRTVLAGGESLKFERWVVSQKGTAIHLWTHTSGNSETLCGRSISKNGYQLFGSVVQYPGFTECARCAKIAAASS